jgi:hypothetical protein
MRLWLISRRRAAAQRSRARPDICTSTCILGCLTTTCCRSIRPLQRYLTSLRVTAMPPLCALTLINLGRKSNNRWRGP